MRIVGIIPARGGSKRLKNKNIYPLYNKPLIMWTIEAALKSKYLDKTTLYVSTESKAIKGTVADSCQIIDRPNKLAKYPSELQGLLIRFSIKFTN